MLLDFFSRHLEISITFWLDLSYKYRHVGFLNHRTQSIWNFYLDSCYVFENKFLCAYLELLIVWKSCQFDFKRSMILIPVIELEAIEWLLWYMEWMQPQGDHKLVEIFPRIHKHNRNAVFVAISTEFTPISSKTVRFLPLFYHLKKSR